MNLSSESYNCTMGDKPLQRTLTVKQFKSFPNCNNYCQTCDCRVASKSAKGKLYKNQRKRTYPTETSTADYFLEYGVDLKPTWPQCSHCASQFASELPKPSPEKLEEMDLEKNQNRVKHLLKILKDNTQIKYHMKSSQTFWVEFCKQHLIIYFLCLSYVMRLQEFCGSSFS